MHRPLSVGHNPARASNTPDRFFVYDAATVNSVAMVNAKGRLAEAYTCSSPCTKTTDLGFSYTGRGEISDEYQMSPNSGGYYHENLAYWENGATKQISGLVSLPTFTYGLDPEGRINSIAASVGQNPLTSTVYNAASLPTTVNLGSGDNDTFTYDNNTNRMTKYQFNINAQAFSGTPTWNKNGTLSTLAITDPFNAADTQSCTYTHDDLARIASANCGTAASQTFTYDAFGNISKSGSPNSFLPTYTSNPPTNRVASSSGFTYDADGNVLNDGLLTRTFDADDFLVTGNGTSVTIDALGRAIDSGFLTATFYSPDGLLRVAYKTQVANRAFLQLPGGGFATYDETNGGLIEYNHPDHLGSARLTTTPSRTFAYSKAYAPFGEIYATSLRSGSFFTGQGNFFNLDTYEFPAREYVDQGRWASPDPAGLAAASLAFPQSWNRYAYVSDNPLSLIDPLGLFQNVPPGCIPWYPVGGGPASLTCLSQPWLTDPDFNCHFNFGTCENAGSGGGGGGSSSAPQPPSTAGAPSTACVAGFTAAGAIAGGAVGNVGGGIVGGLVGGAAGGGGGTLVAPGVGTVGGAVAGGAAGAAAGSTAGTWLGSIAGAGIGYLVGNISCAKGGDQNVVPTWAEGQRPLPGESGKEFAKRLCDARYGPRNYPTGPGSEYNKLKKWGDEHRS